MFDDEMIGNHRPRRTELGSQEREFALARIANALGVNRRRAGQILLELDDVERAFVARGTLHRVVHDLLNPIRLEMEGRRAAKAARDDDPAPDGMHHEAAEHVAAFN